MTKDLNEHLQDEIASFFDTENNSAEVERLRKELKEVKKDREAMK